MHVKIKGSSLINELPAIYDDERCVDVTIVCKGNVKLKTHRLLLASVSSLLRDIFEEQVMGDSEIFLPDFSSTDVDNVLRYVYEGMIRLQRVDIPQFISLCELLKLNVPVVANLIVDELDNNHLEKWTWEGAGDHLSDQNVTKIAFKRKSSSSINPLSVPAKILRTEMKRTNTNSVINNLRKAKVSEVPSQAKEVPRLAKQFPKPIPLKHFKDFVCRVERQKAEKNILKLVEEVVQKQLTKVRGSCELKTLTEIHDSEERNSGAPQLKENLNQRNPYSTIFPKSPHAELKDEMTKVFNQESTKVAVLQDKPNQDVAKLAHPNKFFSAIGLSVRKPAPIIQSNSGQNPPSKATGRGPELQKIQMKVPNVPSTLISPTNSKQPLHSTSSTGSIRQPIPIQQPKYVLIPASGTQLHGFLPQVIINSAHQSSPARQPHVILQSPKVIRLQTSHSHTHSDTR